MANELVAPMAVQADDDPDATLVFASRDVVAMGKYLMRRKRIMLRADRLAKIDRGEVAAWPLYPYALVDPEDPHFRRPIFGRDHATVEEFGRKQVPNRSLTAVAADAYEAIHALPVRVLVQQCAYIWPDTKVNGRFHRIAPRAWSLYRNGWGKTTEISLSQRAQLAGAIRLAMVVPLFGATITEAFVDGPAGAGDKMRMRRPLRLHRENVPRPVIEEMFDRVGPHAVLLGDAAAATIEQFCDAYGFNANELRWGEIAALWTEGIEGLEKRRLDGTIRDLELFRHVRPGHHAEAPGGPGVRQAQGAGSGGNSPP